MDIKEKCPYQKVQYLEVDETCNGPYIDTEYVPNGYLDLQMVFMMYPVTLSYCSLVLNYPYSNEWQTFGFVNKTADSINPYNGQLGSNQSTIDCKSNVVNRLQMYGESRLLVLNGSSSIYLPNLCPNENTGTLRIFSIPGKPMYGRIYSLRLDKSKQKILDLIPVRIGDNGYLYNKVDGRLFGNANLNSNSRFIFGPDIK